MTDAVSSSPVRPHKAAVLGWPVSHSLSPRLHSFWLNQYGIEGSYEAIATPPDTLQDTLRHLMNHGYKGANLTLPLKEQVMPWLDSIDIYAKYIGAVNTIVIKDGKIEGRNTDAYGFIANLKAHDVSLSNITACVVGAGGAARAVIAGLQQEGAHILLTNRTYDRSVALAESLRKNALPSHEPFGRKLLQTLGFAKKSGTITVIPWEVREACLRDVNLLVNTTSLGMKGAPPLKLSLEYLRKSAVVADIVYTPLVTPLLEDARARNHKIVTGLGMLLYQAQPAFAAWFGVTPEVTPELKKHIAESL